MAAKGPPTVQISISNRKSKFAVVKDLRSGLTTHDAGGRNTGVYLVRRRRDGKLCVRKDMTAANESLLAVARTEIDITRSLDHPNVIEYVAGFSGSTPRSAAALYTGFCDLGTFAAVSRMHRECTQYFPEAFIRHLLYQITAGLAYLHDGVDASQFGTTKITKAVSWKPIVHSDLKAQNIFLASGKGVYPRLMIADFGCAVREGDARYHGDGPGGSITIWPPEWPLVTEASDIWSIAAVVQNSCRFDGGPMLRFPPNIRPTDWVQKAEAFRPRSTGRMYSKELGDLVGWCQEMDPTQRPTAQDLGLIMKNSAFRTCPVPEIPLFTTFKTKSDLKEIADRISEPPYERKRGPQVSFT
ncbi:MAG: hypothetical protein M1815_000978 [Lichina confinis]|nr:MAG: hypothetical protein M1815_000978 [Lichina confinis]